jgi:hypothetical protein
MHRTQHKPVAAPKPPVKTEKSKLGRAVLARARGVPGAEPESGRE